MNRREFVATTAALAGTVGWQPQKQAKPTVILFQGDSITDCGRNRDSKDANTAGALGTGYPLFAAAASLAARPDRDLKFFNRGISGNKVPDLMQRWRADALDIQPDILSILIGVNDFWHKLDHGYTGSVADYEEQYLTLLDETRRALPKVYLIIFEPFVLRCGAVTARWFPEFDQRRAVAARVAAHANATFVPLQMMFDRKVRSSPPEYWAADGVHPTPAGHALIANEWRRVANV
ncbi:MAG TPA: GDSL-type esterase/lipase family protein [Gemmatimonadales bacterium]|nr:GDSL-type esterase/lipase family protein [Gemmatimonadales bacterium]